MDLARQRQQPVERLDSPIAGSTAQPGKTVPLRQSVERLEALGQLQNLTHLSLRVNGLRGSIPQSLGQLQNLEKPDISAQQPIERLDSPRVTGPTAQPRKTVSLRSNQLSGSIPPALGQLHNLTHLNLRDNPLRGSLPASLVNLTSLAWLVVEDTQVCVPTDAGFQAWLEGIENKRGVVHCTADGDGSDSATPDATSEDETPEPTGTPNLTIPSFSVSPTNPETGTPVTVRLTVKNDGSETASSETVRLYRHRTKTNTPRTGGTELTDTTTTGSLTSGAQITRTILASTPSVTTETTFYYYACVDEGTCADPAELRVYPTATINPPHEDCYTAAVHDSAPMAGDAFLARIREHRITKCGTITLGGIETIDGTRGFIVAAHSVTSSKVDRSSDTTDPLVGHTRHKTSKELRLLLGKVHKLPPVRTEGGKEFIVDVAFVKYPYPYTPGCSLTWRGNGESFCLDDTDQDNYIDRVSPLVIRGRNGDIYRVTGSQKPTKGLEVTYSGAVTGPGKETGSVSEKVLLFHQYKEVHFYVYAIDRDLGGTW